MQFRIVQFAFLPDFAGRFAKSSGIHRSSCCIVKHVERRRHHKCPQTLPSKNTIQHIIGGLIAK
jgi:hypothetical protein